MKVALVQTNATIGDVDGNTAKIIDGIRRAADQNADLAVFPEQSILGYPAKDLLLRQDIIDRNLAALERIAAETARTAAVLGFAEMNERPFGRPLFNSAALLSDGHVTARIRKRLLPTYDVFDEVRYFEPAEPQPVVAHCGHKLGITICEDMWSDEEVLARRLYNIDPLDDLARGGAELLINISASPYYLGKHETRLKLLATHARRHRVPIVFCNQVGGNDELLFDGASCVVDADGQLIAQAKAFEEDLLFVDWTIRPRRASRNTRPVPPICTTPLSWGCAITCTNAASDRWCWAFPAESTRPSSRAWPPRP